MIQSDNEIQQLAQNGMITPYLPELMSLKGVVKAISFGQSSYGYDFRLADEVQIFTATNQVVIDPKQFDSSVMVQADIHDAGNGQYFLLPPHSFALGHTVESFIIPDDIITLCLAKSTYARVGFYLNVTPFEPGWRGCPTIEMMNSTALPMKVYIGEGVGQLLFFKGNPCKVTYADRKGKYQGQPDRVVVARV